MPEGVSTKVSDSRYLRSPLSSRQNRVYEKGERPSFNGLAKIQSSSVESCVVCFQTFSTSSNSLWIVKDLRDESIFRTETRSCQQIPRGDLWVPNPKAANHSTKHEFGGD